MVGRYHIRMGLSPQWTETGALLWHLPSTSFQSLPDEILWNGLHLTRKREFHLTVVGRDDMHRLGIGGPGHPSLLALADGWSAMDTCVLLLDEVWLLQKPDDAGGLETTLAVACLAPAITQVRAQLAATTGCPLPPAPPHVTLYSANSPRGIGVPDMAALNVRRVASGCSRDFGLGDLLQTD